MFVIVYSKEWIEAMTKVKSKLVEVQKVQDETMMSKKSADDMMPNSPSGVQKVCLLATYSILK